MNIARLLAFSTLSLLLGCGGGGKTEDQWTKNRLPTHPTSGKVTYKGEPLPDATVILQSSGTEPVTAAGRTDSAGNFVLSTYEESDGAVAGEHKVIISAVQIEGPPAGANLDEIDPSTREISLIPKKYSDFAQSGLTATVKENGKNTLSFELVE